MTFLAKPTNAIIAIAAFVALFACAAFFSTYSYLLLILSLISIWGLMGLSWNMLGGYAGLVSFGQGAYFGIGAFAVVIFARDYAISPWFSLPLSAVLGGVAALVIGAITLRLREFYFALASMSFPLALLYVFEWAGYIEPSIPIKREAPWTFMQFEDPRILPFITLGFLLAALAASLAIERSRFGLKLVAIRQDELAARTAGIRVFRTKLWAAIISGAMAGVAGGLYALTIVVVTPASVFGMLISTQAIIISMFGGRGTAWGAILGAVVLVPLSELLNDYLGPQLPGIAGVVYGIAIILVVLLVPQGLFIAIMDWVRGRRPATQLVRQNAPNAPVVIADNQAPMDGSQSVLSVDAVNVRFGGVHALQDVSLDVKQNEILGIIGPNGAGKTTLFNVLSGLQSHTSGSVSLNGQPIVGLTPDKICSLGVGRTFQTVRAFKRLTLLENVIVGGFWRFGNDRQALGQAWNVLDRVGLTERAGTIASELNNRELRLMELARALAGNPSLILLDECLAGLAAEDVEHMIATLSSLRDDDLTIVIIEHTIDALAKLADRLLVLNYGSVISEGPPATVLKDKEVVEAYLGKRWAAHAEN